MGLLGLVQPPQRVELVLALPDRGRGLGGRTVPADRGDQRLGVLAAPFPGGRGDPVEIVGEGLFVPDERAHPGQPQALVAHPLLVGPQEGRVTGEREATDPGLLLQQGVLQLEGRGTGGLDAVHQVGGAVGYPGLHQATDEPAGADDQHEDGEYQMDPALDRQA